jgi:riboflavin kinase/FMN adenylyltransferase
LGHRPTFYRRQEGAALLEAFLLDFEGDLYGEEARVSFVERLRDDRQFSNVDDLIAQMGQDVEAARVTLSAARGGSGSP